MSTLTRFPDMDHFQLVTDRFSQPFWDAASQHRLVAMNCRDCDRFRMPPSPFCPGCRSQNHDWVELSGNGLIYSYTVVHSSQPDEVQGALVLALIETEEAPGVRFMSNIVDSCVEDIAVGRQVRLVWQDGPQGLSFPRFQITDY